MNLLFAFLIVASFIQQPNEPPPFFKSNGQRMMTYYRSKDPALGPKWLTELLRNENIDSPWFNGNEHVLMILGSQLGDIVSGSPKLVREYEAVFAETSPPGQRVIIRALTNCGDAETLKKIDGWIANARQAEIKSQLEALKKHLEDPKREHVRDRPAKTPDDLDLLWANFFTTGEYAPISRLLDVFDLPDAPENETMKRVAKWSLGANLQQHPKLVEIVQQHAKDRPEGSHKVINELIVKAPDPNKP
jgi:hypothetical protein